jgi:hypothetical protein
MDAFQIGLSPPVGRSRFRRWIWLAIALALAIGVVAILMPGVQKIHWVGSRKVDIRFIVADELSGKPIAGAKIFVHQESSPSCDNCADTTDFTLTAGADGTVLFQCGDCTSAGTIGPGIDTYSIHLPQWYFRASAKGYRWNDGAYLDDVSGQRQVQRGTSTATLDVAIKLRPESQQR